MRPSATVVAWSICLLVMAGSLRAKTVQPIETPFDMCTRGAKEPCRKREPGSPVGKNTFWESYFGIVRLA